MEITITVKREGVLYGTVTFNNISDATTYLAHDVYRVAVSDAESISRSREKEND